jgi:NAD(P)-dependent dehydrogenase (short-subunit alcohol dehydrogenase family)
VHGLGFGAAAANVVALALARVHAAAAAKNRHGALQIHDRQGKTIHCPLIQIDQNDPAVMNLALKQRRQRRILSPVVDRIKKHEGQGLPGLDPVLCNVAKEGIEKMEGHRTGPRQAGRSMSRSLAGATNYLLAVPPSGNRQTACLK